MLSQHIASSASTVASADSANVASSRSSAFAPRKRMDSEEPSDKSGSAVEESSKRLRIDSPSNSTTSPASSALSSPQHSTPQLHCSAVEESVEPVSLNDHSSFELDSKPRASTLLKARVVNSYPNKPLHVFSFQIPLSLRTGEQDPNAERFVPHGHNELFLSLPLRVMGSVDSLKEIFVVATDLCQLINIRKSNTAKTVCQFTESEKVSMPIVCLSSNGNTSIRLFTCLTMTGIRRLLQSSRSALAMPLWNWISRHFNSFTGADIERSQRVAILTSVSHLRLLYRKPDNINSGSPPLLNVGSADLSIVDVSNESKDLSVMKKASIGAPLMLPFPSQMTMPMPLMGQHQGAAPLAGLPAAFQFNPFMSLPNMPQLGFPFQPSLMPFALNPMSFAHAMQQNPALIYQATPFSAVPPVNARATASFSR
jgi:hypothetical protein